MPEVTRLGLVELDLLATHAGASLPFPLRVPVFGRLPGERDILLATAADTLRLRGLADRDGPAGPAAGLAAALAGRRGTIDLVLTGDHAPLATVAVVHRREAVLCRQILDDAMDTLVDVWTVPLDRLAGTIAALIPRVPAAGTMPITVPAGTIHAAHTALRSGDHDLDELFRTVTAEHGGHPGDLDALVAAGTGITGGGQLGATRTSRHRDTRTGSELSWLDCPSGRLRISTEPPDATGWTSINPLHPNDFHAAVRELVRLVAF